jgi:hypothetical protein
MQKTAQWYRYIRNIDGAVHSPTSEDIVKTNINIACLLGLLLTCTLVPADDPIPAFMRHGSASPYAAAVEQTAAEWEKFYIADKFIPPGSCRYTQIRTHNGQCELMRKRYNSDDRVIVITQSRSLFAIEIFPTAAIGEDQSKREIEKRVETLGRWLFTAAATSV